MQDMPGQVSEPTYVERITKATQGQAPRSTGGENVPDSERLLGKVEMGR
jgi:hypothetical protein